LAKKQTLQAQRVKVLHQVLENIPDPQPIAFTRITWRIITQCGHEFVRYILRQTLKIEANGGMMTVDGSRRRTTSGVFLYLAGAKMTRAQWKRVNTAPRKLKQAKATAKAASAPLPQPESTPQIEAEPETAPLPVSQSEHEPEAESIPAPTPPRQSAVARKKSQPKAKQKPNGKTAGVSRFEVSVPDVPEHFPPHLVSQLQQLRNAANVLRERVQQLESQPSQGQGGLEMTRKLLAKTEGQIAALLEQHTPTRDSETVP